MEVGGEEEEAEGDEELEELHGRDKGLPPNPLLPACFHDVISVHHDVNQSVGEEPDVLEGGALLQPVEAHGRDGKVVEGVEEEVGGLAGAEELEVGVEELIVLREIRVLN